MSNELPHLGDDSTAIVGRFIVLILEHSWLGKENHEYPLPPLPQTGGQGHQAGICRA
jgi:hypothetical protein